MIQYSKKCGKRNKVEVMTLMFYFFLLFLLLLHSFLLALLPSDDSDADDLPYEPR